MKNLFILSIFLLSCFSCFSQSVETLFFNSIEKGETKQRVLVTVTLNRQTGKVEIYKDEKSYLSLPIKNVRIERRTNKGLNELTSVTLYACLGKETLKITTN